MKICFILATRPEIIKCSPLIKLFKKKGIKFFLIHTGQHYSNNLDKIFFRDLKLTKPKYNLHIKSKSPINEGEHTGKMIIGIEKILLKEMPDYVIVHGDTNTTLAGALTVRKLFTKTNFLKKQIRLVHLEAGLRSFDNLMPEEINRVAADHLSDILYTPTKISYNNLKKEGLHERKKILVTGNTIIEAVKENIKSAKKINTLKKFSLDKEKFFLLTLHRPENVDNLFRLKNIIYTIDKLSIKYKFLVIFPIHPRTKKNLKKFKIKVKNIKFLDPTNYMDFLNLQKNAKIVFTDSGGVQEESCILKTPCVTLRKNTERPETVTVGSNIISGYNPSKIFKDSKKMLNIKRAWRIPFGNGNACKIILKHLKSIY
tara:strand:- start:2648 stop:3760 length:1113 start_codon:yes stop_codon:yes gene_type:complete